MRTLPEPSQENDFLAEHIEILNTSLRGWTGHSMIEPEPRSQELARRIFYASFAVVSHDTANYPIFNYGNRVALNLFELDWQNFTTLPSRLSAEPDNRQQRASLLSKVSENGYIDCYQGIRISRTKKRFIINNASIWNLLDQDGNPYGQAALFNEWKYL